MTDEKGSGEGKIRAAVISTDDELRKALGRILADPDRGVALGAEIGLPFTEITEPWLQALRENETELVFVDLEEDPRIGIKFAEFLMDSDLADSMVAVGSDLSQDLLLEAMRVGALEFLQKPVEEKEVADALERIRRKMGRKAPSATKTIRGRAISIFGVKGGVGATTVSANLAIEIHRLTRKRTLLIDLDLALGDTALLLGMEPRFGIEDLVENFHRVDSGLLASYIEHHESGIDLLAAPADPGPPKALAADRVRRILGFLTSQYDYVVVDTPTGFEPAGLAALEAAEEIYLVSTSELGSLRNLGRSLSLLNGSSGNGRVNGSPGRLRLLVNRFEPNQLIPLSEIRETVGMKVFRTLRNDYRAVAEAAMEGKPAAMAKASMFAKDIRALASEITGVPVDGNARSGPLKRLLSGLKDGWS